MLRFADLVQKPTGKNRYDKQLRSRVRKITRNQREQIGIAYFFNLCDVKSLERQYGVGKSYIYKLGKDFSKLSHEIIGEILQNNPDYLQHLKESSPEAYRQVLEWYPPLSECLQEGQPDNAVQGLAPTGSGVVGNQIDEEAVLRAILSLALETQSSSEKTSAVLTAIFGESPSRSTIDNILAKYGGKAAEINKQYDCVVLSKTKAAALDEIFTSNGDPILTMIDLDSTYIIAISPQHDRKKETWEALLLCLKEDCGFNPEVLISDECGCILYAAENVCEDVDVLLDIFHILKDLWDAGKHCSTKYTAMLTELKEIEQKVQNGVKIYSKTIERWDTLLKAEPYICRVLESLEILRKWVSELLGYTGYTPSEVKKLLLFCMDELDVIAGTSKRASGNSQVIGTIHYPKFGKAIDTFRGKIDKILSYLRIFLKKLNEEAEANAIDPELARHVYRLHRYAKGSDAYFEAASVARKQCRCTEQQFYEAVNLVDRLLLTSKRSSSLVENLNSRIRRTLDSKKKVSDGFFELLRLYLNCRKYPRSRVAERKGKSPIELATGRNVDFFELLGIGRSVATDEVQKIAS